MKTDHRPTDAAGGVSRRTFLTRSALAVAGSATGAISGFPGRVLATAGGREADDSASWFEAGIPRLQQLMQSRELSSRELTLAYMRRIDALNPLIHAVIEVNPNAVAIAARLDAERRHGWIRGPLHGIPVLVKDNIATNDQMQTTAGSLALVGSRVPADAPLIMGLRAAGAVILGKANLGEWANFRGFIPSLDLFGWSARGGNTVNPYVLDYTSWGSSSGPAVAAAANLCAAAVGTETDGSIVGPASVNLTVGLKPTVGLISQHGIIPISHSQDTAGPMARTVTDAALLLGAMQSPFGQVLGHALPPDYTAFLRRGVLQGARIGVDRRYFDHYDIYGLPGDEETLSLAYNALDAMVGLGATLIETDTGEIFDYFGDEFTVFLFEFKAGIANYLAQLGGTKLRTLADLIAFNLAHCPAELIYYGQELFEIADSTTGDLADPEYLAARARVQGLARSGIDDALARDDLDAVVAPHLTNSTAAAVAGYPNLSLPVGVRSDGKPAGILLYSTFLREARLLSLAYDLEQELQARTTPQFLGTLTEPANAGICDSLPSKPHVYRGKAHLPHGRYF
jgi:amidase